MSRPYCLIKIFQKRARVWYIIRIEHRDLGFNVDFKTNAIRIITESIYVTVLKILQQRLLAPTL